MAVSADTTVSGVRTTMANGESVDIVHNRVQLEGTIVFASDGVFPRSGEIKLDHDMRYIRPDIGPHVLERFTSYVLSLD